MATETKNPGDSLTDADRFYQVASDFVERERLIRFKGSFYLYKDGIWRKESDENTESWIYHKWLGMFSKAPNEKKILETVRVIQHMTYQDPDRRRMIASFDDPSMGRKVNAASGILDLDTLGLKPYEETDYCFHKLDFDYAPGSRCPAMEAFLSSSLCHDCLEDREEVARRIGFIQEWIGYSLMPGNPFEKALLMTGNGRNGKGTLMHIWAHVLGSHNVSNKDLRSINNPQSVGATRNRLANFSRDTDNDNQLDTGTVKCATAGEPVDANDKYKEPYSFIFTAKIIIACNELPFTRSTDDNVRERFFAVPFDRHFKPEERNINLKRELEAEAGAIFSWAVDGLVRLRGRGRFDVPKKFSTRMEEFMVDNDNVEQWLVEEDLKGDPAKDSADRKELWEDYKLFARESNYKGYGKKHFFNKLRKKGFEEVRNRYGHRFKGLRPPGNSPESNILKTKEPWDS